MTVDPTALEASEISAYPLPCTQRGMNAREAGSPLTISSATQEGMLLPSPLLGSTTPHPLPSAKLALRYHLRIVLYEGREMEGKGDRSAQVPEQAGDSSGSSIHSCNRSNCQVEQPEKNHMIPATLLMRTGTCPHK